MSSSILPGNMPTDAAWEKEVVHDGRKFNVAHYESTLGWQYAVSHMGYTADDWCYSTGPNYTSDPEKVIREHPKNCHDSRAMEARDRLSPWHTCKYDTCCEWLGDGPRTVKRIKERLERYAQSNYEEPQPGRQRNSGDTARRADAGTKRRAVAMVAEGFSQAAVARRFGFSRQAVNLWVKRAKGETE